MIRAAILGALERDATFAELVERTSLPPAVVRSSLAQLSGTVAREIDGTEPPPPKLVGMTPDGRFARIDRHGEDRLPIADACVARYGGHDRAPNGSCRRCGVAL